MHSLGGELILIVSLDRWKLSLSGSKYFKSKELGSVSFISGVRRHTLPQVLLEILVTHVVLTSTLRT